MPTFKDFLFQHLGLFVTGGLIVATGLLGAILYIRNLGDQERRP